MINCSHLVVRVAAIYILYHWLKVSTFPAGPDRPMVELMDVQVSAYGAAVPLTCSVQTEAQDASVEFSWRDTQVANSSVYISILLSPVVCLNF